MSRQKLFQDDGFKSRTSCAWLTEGSGSQIRLEKRSVGEIASLDLVSNWAILSYDWPAKTCFYS